MDPSFFAGMGAIDFGLFIGGFGVGWAAAQRVSVKVANERIEELKQALDKAEARITLLEDQRYRDARDDAGKLDADANLAKLAAQFKDRNGEGK